MDLYYIMKHNLLELFSGTHSVGNTMKDKYNIISLDFSTYKGIEPPTHQVDIMKWDYKQYPKDYFEVIWASPPCVNYSILQNGNYGRIIRGELYTREVRERKMKESDIIGRKVMEIIEYFNPRLWFIENPQTGKMKERDWIKDKPFYDIDYCMFSNWGYRKRTRFWTNRKGYHNTLCNKNCGNMENGKHKMGKGKSKLDRYRIPPKLILDLIG